VSLCECGCGSVTRIATHSRPSRGHVKGQPLRFINGHNSRLRIGEKHPQWKGAEVGYMALHNWLRREMPKTGRCENCGRHKRTDWANLSGQYLRVLADYRELCRKCHIAFDRGLL
jgi:hypothetical protein